MINRRTMTMTSRVFRTAKKFVPGALRDKLRSAKQARQLNDALRQIKELPPGVVPAPNLLRLLEHAWHNEGMSARIEYLQAVARYSVETPGPILECGSGLTTLVMSVLAGRRQVPIWTLEDSPVWHARMNKTLKRNDLHLYVNNCFEELKDYGDFAWYGAPLDKFPNSFSLIVCDGPLGTTKGGRFGLVPVLSQRITAGSIILVDDADRETESQAINRWSDLLDFEMTLHAQAHGKFAVITVLGSPQQRSS